MLEVKAGSVSCPINSEWHAICNSQPLFFMEISLFGTFVIVLAVGAAAQWLGWRLKIPAILLLLGAGLAAGR
jgi:hypothetical protein